MRFLIILLVFTCGCVPFSWVEKERSQYEQMMKRSQYQNPVQRPQQVIPYQPYVQPVRIENKDGVTVFSFKLVIDKTGRTVKGE